jgi:hypothetical protein
LVSARLPWDHGLTFMLKIKNLQKYIHMHKRLNSCLKTVMVGAISYRDTQPPARVVASSVVKLVNRLAHGRS